MAEVMTNEAEVMTNEATVSTADQVANTGSSWGIGKIVTTGVAILGTGTVFGMGFTIGKKIVNGVSDTIKVKAAGNKARKEAEAKKKAELAAEKKAEAEAKEIPTSDEAKEVLEETKAE